jgi:NADP-dependent aldehyde dehydrogenase
VVVKAHPAHAETSERVAQIILKAAVDTKMPANVFAHVHGAGFEVGQALVLHPQTKAVGFTGSYAGGKALFDLANTRKEPIPVFAEMGSVNPVYLLPLKLAADAASIAVQYAGSITLGVGQFCTNPGLIIGIKSERLNNFIQSLAVEIGKIPASSMLHAGILKAYISKRADALAQQGVTLVATGLEGKADDQAVATIATVEAAVFLANPLLHQEVFGPYSLIIQCDDETQMLQVARHMEGQLTSTLMATDADVISNIALLDAVGEKCGRLILNGVPTGVEVCPSMHHGGPFPATTDSRFTSVGVDAIKRFARPLSLQNWPDHFLPTELQDANPVGLLRMVNGVMTTAAVNQ